MALIRWLLLGLFVGWIARSIPLTPSEPPIKWAVQLDTNLAVVQYFPCINLVETDHLASGDSVTVTWTPYGLGACSIFIERKDYIPSFTQSQ